MASILASNQVFTTGGDPFTGVLRIFPNGSAPMFGAVLHYEFDDGYLVNNTGNNAFADDEYCVQWLHFVTTGSSANAVPQACEYVVTINGAREVTDLQAEMMSYDSYVSALTICRADLMAMELYSQSLEAQLQSCQDTAATNITALQDEIQECEDMLTAMTVANQDLNDQLADTDQALSMCQAALQTALEELEAMADEAEVQAQLDALAASMDSLRNSANGITTIRVPSCNAPGTTAEDQANAQDLMQRMAGYGTANLQSKRAPQGSASSAAVAATTARLKLEREALIGKMADLAKYVPKQFCDNAPRVPTKIVNPPRYIPEGAPSSEDLGAIRSRIEEMKKSCGN